MIKSSPQIAVLLTTVTLVLGGCVARMNDTEQSATETAPEVVPAAEAVETVVVDEAAEVAEPAPQQADDATSAMPAENETVYDTDDVIWIQQRLRELGYYDRKVDGAVGPGTREAVRAYQQDQSIRVDGQPTRELRDFMWRNGG